MKHVHVRVDGDIAKIVKQDEIVRGSNNYVCVHLMFDSSWINKNRVVEMKDVEGNTYNTIIENNRVVLPEEITKTSRIYLRIYGRDISGEQKIVTNEIMVVQI